MSMIDAARIANARELFRSGEARRIREALGLHQTDIAHALGVGRSAYALWEQGRRSPRRDAALRVAALFEALAAKERTS